eukprot:NODE_408_length_7975_cov_0.539487.p1 type:complete len:732 gc:universal NODE_408_length_7975_cov_0.539487:1136-3331(+)
MKYITLAHCKLISNCDFGSCKSYKVKFVMILPEMTWLVSVAEPKPSLFPINSSKLNYNEIDLGKFNEIVVRRIKSARKVTICCDSPIFFTHKLIKSIADANECSTLLIFQDYSKSYLWSTHPNDIKAWQSFACLFYKLSEFEHVEIKLVDKHLHRNLVIIDNCHFIIPKIWGVDYEKYTAFHYEEPFSVSEFCRIELAIKELQSLENTAYPAFCDLKVSNYEESTFLPYSQQYELEILDKITDINEIRHIQGVSLKDFEPRLIKYMQESTEILLLSVTGSKFCELIHSIKTIGKNVKIVLANLNNSLVQYHQSVDDGIRHQIKWTAKLKERAFIQLTNECIHQSLLILSSYKFQMTITNKYFYNQPASVSDYSIIYSEVGKSISNMHSYERSRKEFEMYWKNSLPLEYVIEEKSMMRPCSKWQGLDGLQEIASDAIIVPLMRYDGEKGDYGKFIKIFAPFRTLLKLPDYYEGVMVSKALNILQLCSTDRYRGKRNIIRPGCSIGIENNPSTSTLSLFFVSHGKRYGLLSGHLFSKIGFVQGAKIMHPGGISNSKSEMPDLGPLHLVESNTIVEDQVEIGNLTELIQKNLPDIFDFGIFQINSSIKISNKIDEEGSPLSEYLGDPPEEGNVKFFGTASFEKTMLLTSSLMAKFKSHKSNAFITVLNTKGRCNSDFYFGDSGAPVVVNKTECMGFVLGSYPHDSDLFYLVNIKYSQFKKWMTDINMPFSLYQK